MRTVIMLASATKVSQLVMLLKANLKVFDEIRLLSTTESGEILERETGLEITHLFPARKAGDIQLCGLITTNSIEAVIFLDDPLGKTPADPDLMPFIRACDINNVPLATNIITAYAVVDWLGRDIDVETLLPPDERVADAAGGDPLQ